MRTPEQESTLCAILTTAIAEAQRANVDMDGAAEDAACAFVAGLAVADADTDSAPNVDPRAEHHDITLSIGMDGIVRIKTAVPDLSAQRVALPGQAELVAEMRALICEIRAERQVITEERKTSGRLHQCTICGYASPATGADASGLSG